MLIGDVDFALAEAILIFFLIASLGFSILLFRRGEGNYSIKYKVMGDNKFFRENQWALYAVECLYKAFFILPFILLIALTVIQGIANPLNIAPISINGLIIILILYPTKAQLFYVRLASIWLLTFGSQLSTLFIYLRGSSEIYYIISVIFYTGNILFFFMSLLAIQGVYWEISEAIAKFPSEVSEVNQQWVKGRDHIPFLFHGGIYGLFCNAGSQKNKINAQNGEIKAESIPITRKSYKIYILLYFISLIFLGVYAYLVYATMNSYLGIVGLVANIIFDIFVNIFAKLEAEGRSLKSIFFIITAGRILSFCFGLKLWILGYCILYFGVSVFIGWMIINRHLPLKQISKENKLINGLKTPQFVLLVLTVEIIIMIISEVYGVKSSENVQYNNIEIPIWQWGILAILAAWVVIIYMVSVRILLRRSNGIVSANQYYFGTENISEYHLYKLLSYLLLIGFGLYSQFYLNDTVILVSCIFIPLIYLCLLSLGVAWSTNQYQILADIPDYNKIVRKCNETIKKRKQIIQKNVRLQEENKKIMMNKIQTKQREEGGFFSSIKNIKINLKEDQSSIKDSEQKQQKDTSTNNIKLIFGDGANIDNSQDDSQQLKQLKDWRNPDEQINSIGQFLSNLTPSDRSIIRAIILFVILSIGYCCACYFWAKSKFGISFTVCLVSYLFLLPFYRYYKRRCTYVIGELISSALGFALGIIYWGIFNSEVIGPLAYSFCYLLLSGLFFYLALRNELNNIICGVLFLFILLEIVFILVTFGIQTETVLVAIFSLIFFILINILVIIYFRLKESPKEKIIIIVCSSLMGGVSVGLAIAGYILSALSSFAIFTICMVLVYLSFLSASIGVAATKYRKEEQNPIVYSSYGSPHYKFDSSKQELKSNQTYMVLFSFSSITLVIYAGIVSIFFQSKFYAICALALLQILNTFIEIMVSISSYYAIGSMKDSLTNDILMKSLRILKEKYMIEETQGEDSPYYKLKFQQCKQEAEDLGGDQNWKKTVKYHNLYIQNVKQEEKFLFFWISLIKFYLFASRKQKLISTLVELKQIEDQLNQAGIFIESLNANLYYKEKYKKVQEELNRLQPMSHVIYEEILAKHRMEQREKKDKNKKLDNKNEQKQAERDEDLFKNLKQTIEPSEQITKFNQLIKDLGRKTLFTDEEFPANQNSLQSLAPYVDKWRRPNVGEILVKGEMSANDVKQGDIGDCYLISSFGVLGDKRIKQSLGITVNHEKDRWNNTKGAYMVRFFKFSRQVFVIIDDQMPTNSQDQWVFAKSQDPNQFWPGILEKAYAKLYSGYHNIVQGKCHRVLSQFTGGFPFEIHLEQYKSNTNGLWERLMGSKNNGYLMGGGTPSNTLGDKAYSKRGIVQGHAYSVLDAREVDQFRVIKLKNPHGSAGKQWIGDFSDKSDMMTNRMLQLLDHQVSDDGFFWMTVEDFVREFKSLYICAVFDDRWQKIGPINSQFTLQNSNGLPNVPGCQKNPHYGIKVTKKCNMFISLTQEAKSALKGQNFIYMRVQNNNQKRMRQQDISSEHLIGKPSRPIDSVTISTQIELQASSYPYTFSLMICTGKTGSVGKYSLQFYSDDKDFLIIEDKQFDLSGKN